MSHLTCSSPLYVLSYSVYLYYLSLVNLSFICVRVVIGDLTHRRRRAHTPPCHAHLHTHTLPFLLPFTHSHSLLVPRWHSLLVSCLGGTSCHYHTPPTHPSFCTLPPIPWGRHISGRQVADSKKKPLSKVGAVNGWKILWTRMGSPAAVPVSATYLPPPSHLPHHHTCTHTYVCCHNYVQLYDA